MTPDPTPAPGGASGSGKRRLGNGDVNRVGLLPTEGWRKRNLQFLGEVLIPSLLAPRQPGRVIDGVPLAGADEIGVTTTASIAEGLALYADPAQG